MAKRIDGKAIAEKVKAEVAKEVAALRERGIQTTLAVILVGEDPASQVYVRNKKRACEALGILSEEILLPADTTQETLLSCVQTLNDRADVNGILCQLPLPRHLDETAVINAISPEKDVDAFHPQNVGGILIGNGRFLPCTPAGVIRLLDESGIEIAGKRCVVIGRSNIVGKPLSMLLLRRDGTVTICHSKTQNLPEICRTADILVAAVGRPRFVTADFVKPGAVVIDVGVNRPADGPLCGDVDFAAVEPIAGAITPVPGGVGPMTIAMLMQNTLTAARLQNGLSV